MNLQGSREERGEDSGTGVEVVREGLLLVFGWKDGFWWSLMFVEDSYRNCKK